MRRWIIMFAIVVAALLADIMPAAAQTPTATPTCTPMSLNFWRPTFDDNFSFDAGVVVINQPFESFFMNAFTGASLDFDLPPYTNSRHYISEVAVSGVGTFGGYSWNLFYQDGGNQVSSEPGSLAIYPPTGRYPRPSRIEFEVFNGNTEGAGLSLRGYSIVYSCAPNPLDEQTVAQCSATPSSGYAPLQVQFSSAGSTGIGGIVSYAWQFASFGTSTQANPSFTFEEPGIHTVTLTVTAFNESTDSCTVDVEVLSALDASFNVSTPIRLGRQLQFTDTSQGDEIASWLWNFGDGTTSTEQNPTHTYTLMGSYTVTLVITGAQGATDSSSQTLNISINVDFTMTPSTGNVPIIVTFADANPASYYTDEIYPDEYTWNFGDGITESGSEDNARQLEHIYELPDTYQVTMSILLSNGETVSATKTLTLADYPFQLAGDFVRPLAPSDRDLTTGYGSLLGFRDNYEMFLDSATYELDIEAQSGLGYMGYFADGGPFAVQAVSRSAGAEVFSVAPGTVTAIEDATLEDCGGGIMGREGSQVVYEAGIFGFNGRCLVALDDRSSQQQYPEFAFELPFTNVQIVTVSYGSTINIRYAVTNARRYVRLFDEIGAGCRIGQTLTLYNKPIQDISGLANFLISLVYERTIDLEFLFRNVIRPYQLEARGRGVSIISAVDRASGREFRLLPSLTEDRSSADTCANAPVTRVCVGPADPTFLDEAQWNVFGGSFGPNSVILNAQNGRIQSNRDLTLLPGVEYTVTTNVRAVNPQFGGAGQRFRVVLGAGAFSNFDLDNQFGVDSAIPYEFKFTPESNQAFFRPEIVNTGTAALEVSQICITEGDLPETPPQCFFQDASFDTGGSDWIFTGGARVVSGQVLFPRGAGMTYNNLTLYPADAQSGRDGRYFLTVEYQPWRDGASGGASDIDIELRARWPIGSQFGPFTIVSEPSFTPGGNPFLPGVSPTYLARYTVEVTGSQSTTSTLTINADFGSSAASVIGIKINRICLEGQFDGVIGPVEPPPDWFPPTDPDDPNAPVPTNPGYGVLPELCAVIPLPDSDTIGGWTLYMWGNLRNFFQCDLMRMINRISAQLKEFMTLVGMQMRYWKAAALNGTVWLSTDVFPWLDGHFRNIAVGQVTNVQGGAEQCNNIFCLFTGLFDLTDSLVGPILNMLERVVGLLVEIVGGVASLLLDAIEAIISLLLAVFTQAFNLLSLGQQLLYSIVNAYQTATPINVPGAPNCSNYRSSGFCVAIWVVDNTIFSGVGAAIIPILVGILSIHLLIWVVNKMRRTVEKIGAAT